MAAETHSPEPAAAEAPKEEVVVTKAEEPAPAPAKKGEDLKEVLAKEVAEEAKEDAAAAATTTEEEVEKDEAKKEADIAAVQQSPSFKEESNVVADLIDPHKKALDELKQLVAAALANHEFTKPPPPPPKEEEKKPAEEAVKEEEKKPSADEGIKEEEKKAEESSAVTEAEAAAMEEEHKKAVEEATKEDAAPAAKPEEAAEKPVVEDKEVIKEAVVVEEPVVEEKKSEVPADEDGAKTVEAIEETVVASTSTTTPATEEKPAEAAAEEEKKSPEAEPEPEAKPEPEEVFLWGIPLLGDDRSDTILLKFLRAREYKPKEALAMMKNTVQWRKEFGADALLEEDLGVPGLEKAVFTSGFSKEGHPVCYNTYGEFQDKELYQSAFGDEEKRKKFLRWRVQFLEKGIREQLDFSPTGVCTMVQVNDFKDAPWVQKKELRVATKQALVLLQDNYPEFVHKQIFIRVPWWYLAFNRMISPFLTQRTKSKMVFAGPSKSAETLFKYIAPEQVPVQFGGLKKDDESDFDTSDAVTDVTIKPSSKHTVEIPVSEICSVLVWELRVLGWDVSFGAEFVPDAEGGYTVIVQKSRKLLSSDDPVEKNTFKIGEPGKIVLTVDNTSSKKKKLLYRTKVKSSTSDN